MLNDQKPRAIRLPLKVVVPILAIVLSIAGCVWVFVTPWRTSRKNVVSLEDILDRTRKTSSLCIMKVFAKGVGIRSEGEDSLWGVKARGWRADNIIDIIIDLGKVSRKDMVLVSKSENSQHLTIILPPPEFDERTFSYDPKNSNLVINHGNINDSKFRDWSAECFGIIKNRITETVRNSDVLVAAREPSRAEVKHFLMSMGIDEVTVRFKDEESDSNQNSTTTQTSDNRKE